MQTAHKILGWDETVTTCDCCGKAKLSGTFAVDLDGDILHYGSTCVTRNTGVKNPKSAAEKYQREQCDAAKTRIRQTVEFHAYRAKLAECTRMVDRKEIEIGKACRDFSAAEHAALDVVTRKICSEIGVPFQYA